MPLASTTGVSSPEPPSLLQRSSPPPRPPSLSCAYPACRPHCVLYRTGARGHVREALLEPLEGRARGGRRLGAIFETAMHGSRGSCDQQIGDKLRSIDALFSFTPLSFPSPNFRSVSNIDICFWIDNICVWRWLGRFQNQLTAQQVCYSEFIFQTNNLEYFVLLLHPATLFTAMYTSWHGALSEYAPILLKNWLPIWARLRLTLTCL
jgi:hypothetical protein